MIQISKLEKLWLGRRIFSNKLILELSIHLSSNRYNLRCRALLILLEKQSIEENPNSDQNPIQNRNMKPTQTARTWLAVDWTVDRLHVAVNCWSTANPTSLCRTLGSVDQFSSPNISGWSVWWSAAVSFFSKNARLGTYSRSGGWPPCCFLCYSNEFLLTNSYLLDFRSSPAHTPALSSKSTREVTIYMREASARVCCTSKAYMMSLLDLESNMNGFVVLEVYMQWWTCMH